MDDADLVLFTEEELTVVVGALEIVLNTNPPPPTGAYLATAIKKLKRLCYSNKEVSLKIH